MQRKNAFFLLLSLVLLWGASYPINKIGLYYTTPFNFNELRFLIGTVASLIAVLFTKNFIIPQKRDWPIILTMSIFQIGLLMNLSNYGLSLIGAGRAAILVYTTSIWIIPLSALLHKRIKKMEVISFIIGVIGIIVLISPWRASWYRSEAWKGDIFLILAAFSWAIGILCGQRIKWYRTPLQLLPWELGLCTIATGILSYLQGTPLIPKQLALPLVGSLLYSGIAVIGIGQWIMFVATQYVKPSIISFGLIWIPIISLLISCIFMKESITLFLVIGLILIMTGILLHVYSENKIKTHSDV